MKAKNGSTSAFIKFILENDDQLPAGEHVYWPFAVRKGAGYGAVRDGGTMRNAHRVVLERSLGRSLRDGMIACHVAECVGQRLCVRPSHLYEGTPAENAADRDLQNRTARRDTHGSRTRIELRPRGERHHWSKLSVDDVRNIRSRMLNGESQASIARAFGVTPGAISHIKNGLNWGHQK